MEVQIYLIADMEMDIVLKKLYVINSILRKEIKVEIGKRREGDSKMIVSDVTNDLKTFFK